MKTIISDTADVLFKRKSDGKVIFTGEAQLASVSQSITENKLKGGIGNRTIAVLRSDKEVELQVKNAVFDSDWLEMTSGVAFANGSAVIHATDSNLTVASNAVTLTTPTADVKADGTFIVVKADGTQVAGTYDDLTNTVTATGLTNGAVVSVVFQKSVTGKVLTLQSDKFSEAYQVEYHTIEYNIESNTIENDLYFVFNHATPSGNWSLSFENGQAITPELNFTVTTPPGSNELGQVIEVPRA